MLKENHNDKNQCVSTTQQLWHQKHQVPAWIWNPTITTLAKLEWLTREEWIKEDMLIIALILIYLLTATGLTPSGSNTVHIYT